MDQSMEVDHICTDYQPPSPIAPSGFNLPTPPPARREGFREIQVKIHIRKPEKDTWTYLGRGLVSQEVNGHSSRVVVRTFTSRKEIAVFDEETDLQVEKRGNFVIVGCVQGSHVVSWSFNALNNSETLRLLASIELACYKCQQATSDPRMHVKVRRRIDRVIRDDRRRRHRRRKDHDALIDAFARHDITEPVDLDTPRMLNSKRHTGNGVGPSLFL